MRPLADTHAFLWFILDGPQLSAQAKALMDHGEGGDCKVSSGDS